MSELANNKSIRKEVNDLGETLGITPNGKTNQQKIRSIGEQASDGTYATKEYVNTLMSGALKRQIVETLPVEDIDTNTIYMVLDQSASQQGNVYNEYMYINNAWELIGTTATSGVEVINLADYVGQHITYEQFGSVMDNRAKFEYNGVEVFSVGEEGEGHWIFASTLHGGEYLQVTFTLHNDQEEDYFTFVIDTISVGGSGGGTTHYACASFNDDGGYSHNITFQCDDTTIANHDSLASYLISKGFDKNRNGVTAFLPVVDYNPFGNSDYRIISGIRGAATVSSSSTSYEIEVLYIYNIDSLTTPTSYVSINSFTITHLE